MVEQLKIRELEDETPKEVGVCQNATPELVGSASERDEHLNKPGASQLTAAAWGSQSWQENDLIYDSEEGAGSHRDPELAAGRQHE